VGDDAYGELLAGSLRGAGVDTAGVLVGGAPTGVALITVDPSGENSIVVSPGANARLTPGDVLAADGLFAAARVVSLQLEIPLETVAAAVAAAGAAGARVVLNPSPPAELPSAVLAACDPLVLNEHEARLLLGAEAAEGTPEAYASALRALGPRSVVITLGASGALLLDESGAHAIPGVPVTAVDTTGAGDAFTAALAHRLAAGDPLPVAAAYATRVAAVSVTRPGAQSSYPTAAETAAL
jgi:ribokinase